MHFLAGWTPHGYIEPLNTEDIEIRYKHILESSRVMSRQSVDKNTLNQLQEIACDLIEKALKINMGQSITDDRNDISWLQLLLGKGEWGK